MSNKYHHRSGLVLLPSWRVHLWTDFSSRSRGIPRWDFVRVRGWKNPRLALGGLLAPSPFSLSRARIAPANPSGYPERRCATSNAPLRALRGCYKAMRAPVALALTLASAGIIRAPLDRHHRLHARRRAACGGDGPRARWTRRPLYQRRSCAGVTLGRCWCWWISRSTARRARSVRDLSGRRPRATGSARLSMHTIELTAEFDGRAACYDQNGEPCVEGAFQVPSGTRMKSVLSLAAEY